MKRLNLTKWQFEYALKDMDIRKRNISRLEDYFVNGKDVPQIAKENQVTPAAIRQAVSRVEEQLIERLTQDNKVACLVFLDEDRLPTLREEEEGVIT